MGSKATKKSKHNKGNLKEENLPEKDTNMQVKDSFDMEKARNLMKYLLSSGGLLDSLRPEVLQLDDKQFRNLFEGNFDINKCNLIDRNNKVKFEKLVSRIQTYKLLLNQWHKKGDDYYECLKDIWRDFQDLHHLTKITKFELEKQLDEICKSPKWTKEIRDEFKEIIQYADDMSE